MDLKTFLENFDAIAEAPGGIPKLRSLILDLAARGKLVPQNPEDEPADKLFKKIQENREIIYSKKKASRKKDFLPLNCDEIPFSIPRTWKWARLHELCWLITDGTHHTPTYVESGIPFLSVKDVSGGYLDFSNTRFVTREAHEELCARCKPEYGDILLTKVGTTGIAVEIDIEQEFSIFVSVALLKHFPRFTYPKFLKHLLNSSFVKAQSKAGTEGVGNKNLVLKKIYNFVVPLPPLAEQKRIIEKVDELMALCDRYEIGKQTRDNRQQKLRESAIAGLMNAETDKELDAGWAFVRDNWHSLSQKPEDVDSLRQTVLQLAVRGKLVPQNPEDEPAKISLSEVALEKQKLIKAGQLKEFSSLAAINTTKLPSLPSGWSYCYLQDLTVFGPRNGYSPKAVEYPTPVRSITLSATTSGKFNGKFFKYLDEEIEAESYLWLQPGDLLIQRSNTLAYVGTAAVYDQAPGKYIFPDLIMRIRLSEKVNVNYIHIFLSSRASKEHFQRNASGTSGTMPKINQKIVNSLIIPLPPLAEQKRIVAKVDELMKLCDQLEASLRQSRQWAENFAASAISHLTI